MEILFLHPNFPGQFRRLAPALARLPGVRVVAAGDAGWMSGPDLAGLAQTIRYRSDAKAAASLAHPWARPFDSAVRRGHDVLEALAAHKRAGLEPDVIFTHPGWGDALYLRDFFPGSRIVSLFEYYYRARGADVGFDPEFPASLDDVFRLRTLNATQLLALDACDAGWSPTHWQRSLFPSEWQGKLQVLHEGIDTRRVAPDPGASVQVGGLTLQRGDEILTFVSRNLEPYRGFHVFMRALPEILRRRPGCRVLIAGGDGVSYGRAPDHAASWREALLREVGPQLDTARVHFLGKLPYDEYLRVLQVSRLHVYLTYPFILSWSCLEAMAAGCVVLASATPPVQEVIEDGVNGLLFPFASPQALAARAVEVLGRPEPFDAVARGARRTVVERYDFETRSLPAFQRFLAD